MKPKNTDNNKNEERSRKQQNIDQARQRTWSEGEEQGTTKKRPDREPTGGRGGWGREE